MQVYDGLFPGAEDDEVSFEEMQRTVAEHSLNFDWDKFDHRERSMNPPVSERTKRKRKANKRARAQRRHNR